MNFPAEQDDAFHYPSPSTAEWQERWVEAVLATPDVNVPRAALEAIAPFIVHPKDTVSRTSPNKAEQLRQSVLRTLYTDAGQMLIAVVQLHGCAGAPWERNERVSTSWIAPADPGAGNSAKLLPPLRPWSSPSGELGAALRVEVPGVNRMREILEHAGNELGNREGRRTYDLVEDLALNGQIEPCLYVAQEYRLGEPADFGDRQRGSVWAWPAVRGNNRTRARQQLLDLSAAEVLTGVASAKIGRPDSGIFTNPTFWLKEWARLWNARLREAIESEDFDAPAYRARRVAAVEAHLVIGTPTPQRLYQVVQTSNRRDHAHPPLEFTPNDRGRALGRSIIGTYVARGILDQKTADVLTGDLPITELAGVAPDTPVSVQRDIRSMRLLQEFFPRDESAADKLRRRCLRSALSEPAPSQLSREHVNQRLRTWSAMTSISYPEPWNPRVADVLPVATAKDGIAPSTWSLPELLEVALEEPQALYELLYYRAPHWLAAFDIVDADRGSMGAQSVRRNSQDEDDEQTSLRLRRSVTNAIKSMQQDPVRAVGLLREIAAAMDEGRNPRQVRGDGAPSQEEDAAADQPWFDYTFPKVTAARGRITLPAISASQALPETDGQAVERLIRELHETVESLQEGAKLIPELAAELRAHARAAGIARPLTHAQADGLVATLARLVADVRELPELVVGLSREER